MTAPCRSTAIPCPSTSWTPTRSPRPPTPSTSLARRDTQLARLLSGWQSVALVRSSATLVRSSATLQRPCNQFRRGIAETSGLFSQSALSAAAKRHSAWTLTMMPCTRRKWIALRNAVLKTGSPRARQGCKP